MKQSIMILIVALMAMAGGITARNFLSPLFTTSGSQLSEFGFPDLSGKEHRISEWRGKILVINFWATWCPPCREEIPELTALQQQYSEQGLQIIGIAVEDREPVEEYIDFVKINYPILVAGDQGVALARKLGNIIGAVPYTVVVDRQGQVIHRQTGQMSKKELLKIIEPLMK